MATPGSGQVRSAPKGFPAPLPVGAPVGLIFALGGVAWKYGRQQ